MRSVWVGAPALLTALLVATVGALALVVGVAGVVPASAATATYTYDTAAYVYDAPAQLSSPDVAATYVRGSPSGPAGASWGRSAPVGGVVVAAETGGRRLVSRLRALDLADDTGAISLGNRLRPNYAAEGPHSTFRTGPDGSVTHYATWEPQSNPMNPAPWEMVKRVDVVGDAHFNQVTGAYVDTPHVQGPSIPGGVRPAEPWELP